MDLLTAHILGVEYDLAFEDVMRKMDQTCQTAETELSLKYDVPGYTHHDLVFYDFEGQIMRAYSLGCRKIDDRLIDHSTYVVIKLEFAEVLRKQM